MPEPSLSSPITPPAIVRAKGAETAPVAEAITLSATHDDTPKPFPLLDLPPEIWSKIAIMAVEAEPPHGGFHGKFFCGNRFYTAPITRTCKALRNETLPHFAAQAYCYFDLHDPEDIRALDGLGESLRSMSARNRRAIRNFFVISERDIEQQTVQEWIGDRGWDFEFEVLGYGRCSLGGWNYVIRFR